MFAVHTGAPLCHADPVQGPSTDPTAPTAVVVVPPAKETVQINVSVDKKDEDEPKIPDLIKSGVLMRHGLAIGAALQLHPVFASTGDGNSTAEASAGVGVGLLTYAAIFPAYWRHGEEQNIACAGIGDADDAALKRARVVAERELRQARAIGKDVSVHEANVAALSGKKDAKECEADETCKAAVKAEVKWTLGVAANCFWHRIGAYAGYPFSQSSMNVTLNGTERGRATTGIISFGLDYAPRYFLHLMLGVTVLQVQKDSSPTTFDGAGTSVAFLVPTASIGTSLDILGAVLGK